MAAACRTVRRGFENSRLGRPHVLSCQARRASRFRPMWRIGSSCARQRRCRRGTASLSPLCYHRWRRGWVPLRAGRPPDHANSTNCCPMNTSPGARPISHEPFMPGRSASAIAPISSRMSRRCGGPGRRPFPTSCSDRGAASGGRCRTAAVWQALTNPPWPAAQPQGKCNVTPESDGNEQRDRCANGASGLTRHKGAVRVARPLWQRWATIFASILTPARSRSATSASTCLCRVERGRYCRGSPWASDNSPASG